MHIGHEKIIQKAIEVSCKEKVYVCSFCPHPLQVIMKENPPKVITPIEEKKRILECVLGVNYKGIKFDEDIAKHTGEQFIKALLEEQDIENIVVGANYFFGHKAMYSTEDLKQICAKYNINVYVVDEFKLYGEVVSSTRIRQCLDDGDIELANELLGRSYSVSGICQRGKCIGMTIGYATANLPILSINQYPKKGVYISKTIVKGEQYYSMTNVGKNPTVDKKNKKTIETHILDFDKELYGVSLRIEFLSRIRDEKKFNSIDELKAQLDMDKQSVINFINKSL